MSDHLGFWTVDPEQQQPGPTFRIDPLLFDQPYLLSDQPPLIVWFRTGWSQRTASTAPRPAVSKPDRELSRRGTGFPSASASSCGLGMRGGRLLLRTVGRLYMAGTWICGWPRALRRWIGEFGRYRDG